MTSPRSPTTGALPPKKITLHKTSVSTNSAAMAILLIQPRSVTPTTIHTTISAPITRHHTHRPTSKMPPTASALVIDHDGRPADELQHIQKREQQAAAPSEGHLHRLHGALFRAPADQAGEENSVQPMMWPMTIAAMPFPIPSGAKAVPVRISARETPAPNQIRLF